MEWVLQIVVGGIKTIGVGLTNSCGRSQYYRGGSYKSLRGIEPQFAIRNIHTTTLRKINSSYRAIKLYTHVTKLHK